MVRKDLGNSFRLEPSINTNGPVHIVRKYPDLHNLL
jgi:hypothetical protein